MDLQKLIDALKGKSSTALVKDDDDSPIVIKYGIADIGKAVDLVGDGDDETKEIHVRTEPLSPEAQKNGFTLPFVISDSSVDRDDDTVAVTGHKLANFKKAGSPVLFAHNRSEPVIGRGRKTFVADDKLRSLLQVPAEELHPFGNMVGRLALNGFMKAASIGFRPLEFEDAEDRGRFALNFLKQELLEWSIVPVPANPNAVQGAKDAGINVQPMIEWATKWLDEGGSRLFVPRSVVEEALKEASGKVASVLVTGIAEDGTLEVKVEGADPEPTPPPATVECERCKAGEAATDDGRHVFVEDGKAKAEPCAKADAAAACGMCGMGDKPVDGFHAFLAGKKENGTPRFKTVACPRFKAPEPAPDPAKAADKDPAASADATDVDPSGETGQDDPGLTVEAVEALAEKALKEGLSAYTSKVHGTLDDF